MIVALGWFWHPLNGLGYQFWSGIGSDVGEVTLLGGLWMMWRHHNCHVKGCWRTGRVDSENDHPACKRHHSQTRKLG